MSKRDLKKYLTELNKEQLELQIIELYDKFSNVKVYYDFVFKPNEVSLIKEAKFKISNEYFPIRGKKPKMRRSVAQKFIKLYNLEIAQSLSEEKIIKQELFFKSMFNSFYQAISFMIEKEIFHEFKDRVEAIKDKTISQDWVNKYEFITIVERFDY